jgi:ATP-binding cassette subfamily G (WHITE) protein 2
MFSCPWYQLITLRKLSYGCTGIYYGNSHEDRAAVKKALASAYKSNLAHKVKAELQDSGNEFQIASEDKKLGKWSTTWLQQFFVLLRRCVKERRHESFSTPRVARVLFLALFAGFLWWQSGPANIQDQVSDAFFPFSRLNI